MHPWKVSAQFEALVWFCNRHPDQVGTAEARRFARENWMAFLPSARPGVGRLLRRLARPGCGAPATVRKLRRPTVADVVPSRKTG